MILVTVNLLKDVCRSFLKDLTEFTERGSKCSEEESLHPGSFCYRLMWDEETERKTHLPGFL